MTMVTMATTGSTEATPVQRHANGGTFPMMIPGVVVRHDPYLRARFQILADWWHADTDPLSDVEEKFLHRAYRRIIDELGTEAIPLILEDMEKRGGHWYEALTLLTSDSPVIERTDVTLEDVKDAWLHWGREHAVISRPVL